MTWTAPESVIVRTFRRRRRRKAGSLWIGAVGLVSVALAHTGAGHGATDGSRFNQQTVYLTGVLDGQTLTFTDRRGVAGTLRLLGVAAPLGSDLGSAESTAYLQDHAQGRDATLLLDWPQTRDAQGRLLAFVFLSDDDSLNTDSVRDGAAYAERRTVCLLQEPIDSAERAARKAHLGLWRDLQWDQTPLWRRQWFATRPSP